MATATRIQEVQALPALGRNWMCARFTDAAGATFPGLRGRVTRVAHARANETPHVIEFKSSLSAPDFSPAYVAALKHAGWDITLAMGR